MNRRALLATLTVTFIAALGRQATTVLTPFFIASLHVGATVVGAATTVNMVASTATALLMMKVRTSGDPRRLTVVAISLVGLPCFLMALSNSPAEVLALNAVRGAGFGLLIVLLGSAAGLSASPSRRGLALGLFGVVTSGFASLGQAGGLALERKFGFALAFITAGAVTMIAILPALRTPSDSDQGISGHPIGLNDLYPLLPLAIFFFVVTSTYGAVVSFVPELMATVGAGSAVVFFLLFALVTATSRLASGWLLDRLTPGLVFVTAVVLGAIGLIALAGGDTLLRTVAAPCLYGLSFGGLSTGTQVTMMSRVDSLNFNAVNGLFNAAWNAGVAAGGVGFGAIAITAGYSGMFQLAGIALCVALLPLLIHSLLSGRERAAQ